MFKTALAAIMALVFYLSSAPIDIGVTHATAAPRFNVLDMPIAGLPDITMVGKKCGLLRRSGCGEYNPSAKFQGGGYNPKMVRTTVCLPDDIYRAIKVNGVGSWTLNFAYPARRSNEVIQNVNGQCVTRNMPAGYLAAAYIRCPPYYTGPMAASIGQGGHKTMKRRPDMES
jgi:hypothetical protein